jgi:hypothetical protein
MISGVHCAGQGGVLAEWQPVETMESPAKYVWLRRRGLLLVFLFGYLMIGLLAVEQARTITAQRRLIQDLFQDTLELRAQRMQRQIHRRE